MSNQKEAGNQVSIKVDDQTLKGVYANAMQVAHTKEEFIMDFINLFSPQGIVTARVVTSPGHLKRIIAALDENIAKYESQYGVIEEAPAPPAIDIKPN